MNCCACNEVVNNKEHLKCKLCEGKFHYQCLGLERRQFLGYTKVQLAAWIYPSCSSITRRTRSTDNTPVRSRNTSQRPDNAVNMSCDTSPQSKTSTSPPAVIKSIDLPAKSHGEVTMEKISTLLDRKLNASLADFMENFRVAIRDDIKEMIGKEIDIAMKTIKDDFNATTEFICAEQSTLHANIEKSTETIKLLESENIRLQSELARLNVKLAGIEKISRSCNIELQAVPEQRNENVLGLFRKLCGIIKAPVEDAQISACRRVAKQNISSRRPRNIVVT
jgi:hypothetical protein